MDFSTSISTNIINENNFDAVGAYNKYLEQNSSFKFDDTAPTKFETILQSAEKNYPIKDKNDPEGLGNFANQLGSAFANSINAVNNARLEADRMQEDLATGGPTSIHDAMIAAEKASLSMQMAIQVRNRIISAYTDITTMAI